MPNYKVKRELFISGFGTQCAAKCHDQYFVKIFDFTFISEPCSEQFTKTCESAKYP